MNLEDETNKAEQTQTIQPTIMDSPVEEIVDPVVEEPAEEQSIEQITQIHQNVIMTEAVFGPLDLDKYNGEELCLPADFQSNIEKTLEKVPNIKLNDTEKAREWATTIKEGADLHSFDSVFQSTLENPKAEFGQHVQSSAGKLMAGAAKFKNSENEVLKGERAVLRLRAHIGLGSIFRVPLWNSGFWITFKAPSEGDLLELHRQIISDKISLGRSTYGLAFSNTSSYMMDKLLTFAMDNFYQTNLKVDNFRDLISAQDIPTIVWGIACTIWPNGFKYNRACLSDPEKCQHVVSERLNLSKLQWTNTKGLTQWQISHMANIQSNTVDRDSVLRYQKEILQAQNREIIINKGTDAEIGIILKVPTANEYIASGNRWISTIVDNVTKALGMNANSKERDEYILNNGRATAMRQYIHWVSSIRIGTNSIEDTETLESTFDTLSSDDKIREEFMEGIESYINDSALTVIGVPTYDCPKCGSPQNSHVELPRHTNVIPIDVYNAFFILLVQRLQKIQSR